MKPLKYYTLEGDVYVKKTQTALYISLAVLLLGLMAIILYKNPNKGANIIAVMFGLLGVVLLLRCKGKFSIDPVNRTIINQPFFFAGPTVYGFDDFQNFLISRQTFIITLNATATMVMNKNGRNKNVQIHQTVFLTKPLQAVTEETADIMGIPG